MIELIDREKCTGCGICVDRCPLDTLRLEETSEGSKACIAYGDDCMTCFECEVECPSSAIRVHPFKEELPPTIDYESVKGGK
jgi:NAD-dependent dihydropyrimidine dehydrogenase PreA subunit